MLGVAVTSWHLLRRACKRTQQLPTLWRLSKEAMHSGTVILAMHVHRRFHEVNVVVVPCTRFVSHRTIEILGLVAPKVWPVSSYTKQEPTMLRVVGQQILKYFCIFSIFCSFRLCMKMVSVLRTQCIVGRVDFIKINRNRFYDNASMITRVTG